MRTLFLLLSLLSFSLFGQIRPKLNIENSFGLVPGDSILTKCYSCEILLIRYLPTRGEWGGTTDTIRIYRSDETTDSIRKIRFQSLLLRADYCSIEQVFGYDTMAVLNHTRMDSVLVGEPINELIQQAMDEVYQGTQKIYNSEMGFYGDGYFEISMGWSKSKDFKLSTKTIKNKWESFEKLKEIIELSQNR